jgi:hypothetical protein
LSTAFLRHKPATAVITITASRAALSLHEIPHPVPKKRPCQAQDLLKVVRTWRGYVAGGWLCVGHIGWPLASIWFCSISGRLQAALVLVATHCLL